MDKSREQFEQVAAKMLAMSPETIKSDRRGDKYNHKPLMQWWQFWQASRAAIEIELPDITAKKYQSKHIAGGFRSEAFWLDTRKVIRDTGIKVNDIANGTDTE